MPARPYRPVHRPDETPTRVGPNGSRRPSPYDGMGNDPDDRYRPDHCPHCLIYLSGSKERGYLCAICEPIIDPRIWLVLRRAAAGVCSGRCGGYLSPEERSAQRYMCDRCLPGWRAHVQNMADSGIVSGLRRREFRALRHSYEADMREQTMVGGRCINLRCAKPMQWRDCFDPWVPSGYRFAYCSSCRLELTVDGYPDPARMALTEYAVHNTAAPQVAHNAGQNQTAGHSAAGNTTGGFNIHHDRAARASEGMNPPPFLTGDDVLAAERLLQMRSGQFPSQQFPNQQYTDENRQPSGGSGGASTLVNTRAPLGDRSGNI